MCRQWLMGILCRAHDILYVGIPFNLGDIYVALPVKGLKVIEAPYESDSE